MSNVANSVRRSHRTPYWRHIVINAGVLAVALVVAYLAPPSSAPIWSLAFVVAALGVAFQVVYGLLGELSLGHTAFFGSAAYGYAFTTTNLGLPVPIAVPLGVVIGAVVGYLIAQLTARLNGVYFSVVTYAINFVAMAVVLGSTFLGREEGIGRVPSFTAVGDLAFNYSQVLYTASALIVLLVVFSLLRASRLGRFIEVVRADAKLAASLAISHGRVRIIATLMSGAMAGFAGVIYAQMSRFVSPDVFGLYFIVIPLAAVAIGGRRWTYASLVGSLVVVVVPLYLDVSPTMNQIIGALLLLLAIVFAPQGILGLLAITGWGRRLLGRDRRAAAITRGDEIIALRAPSERVGDTCLTLDSAVVEFGSLRAVDDFTMSVRAGEVVGLIGPNGAGKSTAVNAIAGVVRLKQGEVRLAGRDITRLSSSRRARLGIGRTFQNNVLAEEMTVAQSLDVAGSRGSLTMRGSLSNPIAEELGVADIGDALVADIGFLERRLLSISMAAAGAPRVLILDEATAGLAAEERIAIANAVRRIANSGTAVIVIEHDVDFVVNLVDRLIVMHLGRLLTEGDPRSVIKEPIVISTYLGVPHDA